MGKKKNEAPRSIELTEEQITALQQRLQDDQLSKEDLILLQGVLSFMLWIQGRLSRAKLSIKRLRKLFGFTSEKQGSRKKNKQPSGTDSLTDNGEKSPLADSDNELNESAGIEPDAGTTDEQGLSDKKNTLKWDGTKNHGRLGSDAYNGCLDVKVDFDDPFLRQGKCPDCAQCNTNATVYSLTPVVLILLDSQPLISGVRYSMQKARCGVCQSYFTARLPEKEQARQKYSVGCKASLAIHHYYAGMPFKRLEMLQAAQGVPLPDATQYDLMNQLYQSPIRFVLGALRQCAANGTVHYFDDTSVPVLEQIAHNKQTSTNRDKKSAHTTAQLSEYQGHRIYLFDTSTLTAGKQWKALMAQRTVTADVITMSDAAASNFPDVDDQLAARWVISLCLSHARRRFVELLTDTDKDIAFVLELIGKVYQHERHCKVNALNDHQRLLYHQQHSKPIMEALRIWLNNLLLYRHVEPNSRWGEAMTYLLKRWQWFTSFLRVAGAPLDNNLCEQVIKIAIRYRKNALFYRTFYGASIGDAMMSVIQTAAHAGVNIFDYLTTLQTHADSVEQQPEDWLPWRYQQTLLTLNTCIDKRQSG